MSADVAGIAVIGGGIAGSATVLGLRRAGADVLWIAPEGGMDFRPGEHLAPAARPILAGLDALHLLEEPCHRPSQTMLSAWGQSRIAARDSIVHAEGPGTILDRARFDAGLAGLAMASEPVRIEARLEGGVRRNGIWHLRTGGHNVTARFLIDATGRAAVVAAENAARLRADRLAALYLLLEQDADSNVTPTPASLVETVHGGWWYAALRADGRLVLNFFSDPDLLPHDVTRDPAVFPVMLAGTRHVGRWVEEAGFRLQGAPSLASAATTWIAPAAGSGWLAVGDAAAAFDPLSSHGMTTALWSAVHGGKAARAALAGDEVPLERYVVQVAAGVQEFLGARDRTYSQEKRFDDALFWCRRVHDVTGEPSARLEAVASSGYD